MGKDVIIALDFDSREKTLAFLDQFTDRKPFVKIGMELFYADNELYQAVCCIGRHRDSPSLPRRPPPPLLRPASAPAHLPRASRRPCR